MVPFAIISLSKSFSNMSWRLSEILHNDCSKSAYRLIRTLKYIIRGYCNSKTTSAIQIGAMRTVNSQLNKLILAWIRRSHPKNKKLRN
ncbi:MAG: hypothetical protein EOP45_03895 [Sphingobacteriaceae bacterium]|nr:MAG: hypothetical protein EOP45_03895 [Sphingobacteriaceae bacterium]